MEQVLSFFGILLSGFWVTVLVTLGAAVVAIPASFAGGLARQSRMSLLRWPAATYVALFRGTSAVVQLYWAYFALPLLGVRMSAMTAGIIVLGLNTAAYGVEVVRGAIASIDQGQWEAGTSLNMSRAQVIRRIILPQALPLMLPSFGNLLVELLKNSALVSLITLADLTFQAEAVLRGQFPAQTLTIFTLLLVIYFCLSQCITFLVGLTDGYVGRWKSFYKGST